MEFRQIRYFMEIQNAGTFQKAAQNLGLTQPALSRQVFLLERELKQSLFHRGPRQVKLTFYGEIFYEYSLKILELWNELDHKFSENAADLKGKYRISAGGTFSALILPDLLRRLHSDFPSLILSITEGDGNEIESSLKQDRVEIGIVSEKIRDRDVISYEYSEDTVVLAASKNYSIDADISSINELKKHPFIYFQKGSAIRKLLDRTFSGKNKFHPNIIMEFRNIESVKNSIEKGLGIGFLSEMYMNSNLKKIRIPDLEIRRKFYICHKKDSEPGIRLLVNKLLSY